MKKLKYGLIILLILVLSGCFIVIYKNNHTIKYTYAVPGMIVKKEATEEKNNCIYLKVLAPHNKTDIIEIIVKDKNVWNLIENNRTYYIIYSYKRNENPILNQIEIDDEFGDINKERLMQE